jgi:hypothetical protein
LKPYCPEEEKVEQAHPSIMAPSSLNSQRARASRYQRTQDMIKFWSLAPQHQEQRVSQQQSGRRVACSVVLASNNSSVFNLTSDLGKNKGWDGNRETRLTRRGEIGTSEPIDCSSPSFAVV